MFTFNKKINLKFSVNLMTPYKFSRKVIVIGSIVFAKTIN